MLSDSPETPLTTSVAASLMNGRPNSWHGWRERGRERGREGGREGGSEGGRERGEEERREEERSNKPRVHYCSLLTPAVAFAKRVFPQPGGP